jgi:hypothetical protein
LTQNRFETPQHPLASIGNILSGIDQVNQSIVDCIKLAETTLRQKEPEATLATAFNRNFDDFIDQLGEVPSPDLVGEIKHDFKPLSLLEEDLDHLLQLGKEEATGRRGTLSSTSTQILKTT